MKKLLYSLPRSKSLLREVGLIVTILFSIAVLVNGISVYQSQSDNYLGAKKNEVLDLVTYTNAVMTEYQALPWLLDYWKEHSKEVDASDESHTLSDPEWRRDHEKFLKRDSKTVTVKEAESFSAEDQEIFAECTYLEISTEFDRLLNSYWCMDISCSTRNSDKTEFLYFSGKIFEPDYSDFMEYLAISPKKTDPYDVYCNKELGEITRFDPDERKIADEIYETGEDIPYEDVVNLPQGECIIMYSPIISEDGRTLALISCIIPWSGIHQSFNESIRNVELHNIITHILIGALLLFVLYLFVLMPLGKVQNTLSAYTETKDSSVVYESLSDIMSKNELGILAEDVKKLAGEMDGYLSSIVRLTAEQERIGAELDVARRIQSGILPKTFPAFPERTEFDIHASMTPAKEIGGDLYDFFLLDEDHLALAIADVSGKGVPAALYMTTVRALYHSIMMLKSDELSAVIRTVNDFMCLGNEEMMFATVWMGVLDIPSGKMKCVNGGHEFPAIRRADGKFELYEDDHEIPIGIMENTEYTEYELALNKGDTLYLYTDGVPEATDSNENLFSEERMLDALNSAPDASPMEINQAVIDSINSFVNDADPFDDCTMLCLKYFGINS